MMMMMVIRPKLALQGKWEPCFLCLPQPEEAETQMAQVEKGAPSHQVTILQRLGTFSTPPAEGILLCRKEHKREPSVAAYGLGSTAARSVPAPAPRTL